MKRPRFVLAIVIVLVSSWSMIQADEWQSARDHFSASQWQAALDALDRIDVPKLSLARRAQLPYLRGECLFQLGDWSRAATEFHEFVDAKPHLKSADQARFRIAEVAFFDGRDATAKAAFQEFRQQHPGNTWNEQVAVYLGLLALRVGSADDAEREFVTAIEQSPSGGRLEAHVGLVQVAFQQRRPNVMLKRLAAVPVSLSPPDSPLPVVDYWRGQAYHLLRNYDSAVDAFDRVADSESESELIRSAMVGAAEADLRRQQFEPAIRRLRLVAERWPKSESAQRALLRLVQLEVDRARYDTASSYLNEFTRRFPNSRRVARARQLVGVIYLRKHDYSSAVDVFQSLSHAPREAVRSDLDRAVNWYYLAEAYYGDGRPKQAVEVLQRIRVDGLPRSLRTRVLFALATLHEHARDYQAAIDVLDRAADGMPAGGAAESRIRAKRVELLCATGRIDRAFQYVTDWSPSTRASDALRINTLRTVAEAAYAAADDRLALQAYQTLLRDGESRSDRADGMSGAAWCLFRLGDRDGAAQLFQRFVNEFPRDARLPNVLLILAELYEGRDDEAAIELYAKLMDGAKDATARVRAGFKRADLLNQLNRADEALQVFEELAAVAEDVDTLDRVAYERAWTLKLAGRREQAAQEFVKLRSLGSERRYWSDVTYRLALMAFEDAAFVESQSYVDELLAFFESSPGQTLRPYVLYLQARLAAEREDWKGVIVPLDEILDETSRSRWGPASLILSAEALYRVRDYPEAQQRLEVLFRDHPKLSTRDRTEGTLRLAEVRCAMGEFEPARQIAEKILASATSNQQARAQCVIGRCQLELGALRAAGSALNAVIDSSRGASIKPEHSVRARRLLADVQFEQRLYRLALRNYLWYLSRDEDTQQDMVAWLQAGKCYERMGQTRQAVKLYGQVKQLAQDTPYHADVIQRLKMLASENPLRQPEPNRHRPVTTVDTLEATSD